jgi:hypothetical protein
MAQDTPKTPSPSPPRRAVATETDEVSQEGMQVDSGDEPRLRPARGVGDATSFPTDPIWHEEIWLSTAVHQQMKGDAEVVLPERVQNKVREDIDQYSITFDDDGVPVEIRRRFLHAEDGSVEWLTVPPPSKRLALVIEAHQWGHFGAIKTDQRLHASGYWWLGRQEDVKNLVERCPSCMMNANYHTRHHPARTLPVPQGIFDRVHMDIMSIGSAEDGAKHVLLFVDALSKFPIAFPMHTKEAAEVAKCLWRTICQFGTPTVLHSDNGAEFVNEVINAMCNLHGIQRRFITAYRPQANGQVERFGRTVASVLRKCCGGAEEFWPEWLDFVLLAIRTTASASTGLTPFEVMFGREFRPLGDYHALVDWSQPDEEGEQLLASRAILLRKLMGAEAVAQSRQALEEGAEVQRATQDGRNHIAQKRLKEGTRVLLRQTGDSIPKLQRGHAGPFFIAHEPPQTPLSANYNLRDEQGQILERSFPRDYLFECPQDSVRLSERQRALFATEEWAEAIRAVGRTEPGPIPMSATAGEEGKFWAVEEVFELDEKRRRARVRWQGYRDSEWIPFGNFMDPGDVYLLFREYQRKMQRKQAGRYRRKRGGR